MTVVRVFGLYALCLATNVVHQWLIEASVDVRHYVTAYDTKLYFTTRIASRKIL